MFLGLRRICNCPLLGTSVIVASRNVSDNLRKKDFWYILSMCALRKTNVTNPSVIKKSQHEKRKREKEKDAVMVV